MFELNNNIAEETKNICAKILGKIDIGEVT